MWHGVPEYVVFVAVVAVVFHLLIRRWLVACPIGAIVCSLANMLHEAWLVNFEVNIAWAPFMFVVGCVLAAPVFAVVGMPFLWLRRRE